MLAAFTQGITEWKLTGPPPPRHFPLTMVEIKLALSISEAEMTGLKDISDWKNPLTFPEEYLEEEGVAAEAEKFSSECPILPELGSLLLSDPARLRIPEQTHATSRLPIVDEMHREPHCISTSRHVQQLMGNTALTSMSPWTLPPPAHLHQDQLVAGGGERGDPLLLLKGWSVGDLFWFAVAIGVSLYVLNLEQIDTMISNGKSVLHEVDKTLQFSSSSELSAEEVSTTAEIPREYLEEAQRRHLNGYRDWTWITVVESLSSSLTSVTVMGKLDTFNIAWKPPWLIYTTSFAVLVRSLIHVHPQAATAAAADEDSQPHPVLNFLDWICSTCYIIVGADRLCSVVVIAECATNFCSPFIHSTFYLYLLYVWPQSKILDICVKTNLGIFR